MEDIGDNRFSPGYDVRPYRSGDEVALAALFTQVSKKEVTPEWWLWKLKGQPSRVENVWVADVGGRIVGQYVGIPVRLKIGDGVRDVDVMVLVDSMALPEYRETEALTKLGIEACSAWASAGVAAVLGFQNNQREPRPSALDRVTLFPLVKLRLPLRWDIMAAGSGRVPASMLPVAKAAGRAVSRLSKRRWQRRTSRNGGISVEEVTSTAMLPALDELWSKIKECYPILIVRDGEWVRWRYLEAIGARYRILLARREGEPAGYLAYSIDTAPGSASGNIADLFTAPDAINTARALVGTALDDLWRRKADSVIATTIPGSSLDRTLAKIGFRPMLSAIGVGIAILDPSLVVDTLSGRETWHLTGGDFDMA